MDRYRYSQGEAGKAIVGKYYDAYLDDFIEFRGDIVSIDKEAVVFASNCPIESEMPVFIKRCKSWHM